MVWSNLLKTEEDEKHLPEIGQIEYELSGPWLQDARNIQNGFHVGLSVNLR